MSEVPNTALCPRCKGTAGLITPAKFVTREHAAYACTVCGLTMNAEGGVIVDSAEKLRDIFSVGTGARSTVAEMLHGQRLNAATKALITAQMVEYGLRMWFDGMKQGILLGVTEQDWKEKHGEVQPGRQDAGGQPA